MNGLEKLFEHQGWDNRWGYLSYADIEVVVVGMVDE
jgi:hypothetical protein